MPTVSKEILDEIRSRNDIVEVVGAVVRLFKAGANYRGLCPFHKEKTPSFHVHPGRQMFHCFGCGTGGDVFTFVMKREGVDFMGAVRWLAARAGIRLQFEEGERRGTGPSEREQLFALHREVAEEYHRVLLAEPVAEEARRYLKQRALEPAVVKEFLIGYAPPGWDFVLQWARRKGMPISGLVRAGLVVERGEAPSGPRGYYDRFRDRLMFPICDEQGRVVGFSGRILHDDSGTAKYVNSPETPIFRKSRILFALHRARAAIVEQRTAVVCEGQIDVIRCHAAGVRNAVASQGTAFTEEHARILARYADRVILVFDPDSAGRRAAIKTGLLFTEAGLEVRMATLPPGLDPDLFIRKEGADAFMRRLSEARPGFDCLLEHLAEGEDLRTAAGLRRVLEGAFEWVARVPDESGREFHLQRLAEWTGANPVAVGRDFHGFLARRTNPSEPFPSGETDEGTPSSTPGDPEEAPPEERLLLEHVAAEPELALWLDEFAPPRLFTHPLCARVAAAMIEANRKGGDWKDFLAGGDGERDERLMAFAAAIQMAPPRATGAEFSTTEAVQSLILRLWVRRLKAEKRTIQQSLQPGDERAAALFRLTAEIQSLSTWKEGQNVIQEYLAEWSER